MMNRVPAVAPLMRALTHAAERVIAEEKVILRDGSAIVIRPLATGDVTAITTWFEGLGPTTRYARFLGIIDRLDEQRLSLSSNEAMLHLFTKLGPTSIVSPPDDAGAVEVQALRRGNSKVLAAGSSDD